MIQIQEVTKTPMNLLILKQQVDVLQIYKVILQFKALTIVIIAQI
jgi:hypothetical protein